VRSWWDNAVKNTQIFIVFAEMSLVFRAFHPLDRLQSRDWLELLVEGGLLRAAHIGSHFNKVNFYNQRFTTENRV
jgi:hypothetical protein